jgi:hypothetical protein
MKLFRKRPAERALRTLLNSPPYCVHNPFYAAFSTRRNRLNPKSLRLGRSFELAEAFGKVKATQRAVRS